MKIAIVSPLFESVPPKLYGGTERVVSYLTEELVRQGHDVTLFASGDSVTRARLRPMCEQSLRLDPTCVDPFTHHLLMMDQVMDAAGQFDVVHFNLDYWQFPMTRRLRMPAVTTLHGRLDLPEFVRVYSHFREAPLVSISNAQRAPIPHNRWLATIHHGLPPDLYRLHEKRGSYLAFLGRISPEKRPDRAILIARRAGIPLKIAAKVDNADKQYFEERIRPLLREPGVEFIGEIGEAEKDEFLGGALALLFPIDWPEPFGLVMIEAMACGTPVIAWRCGSVPEIMTQGITGFIVQTEDEAVAAVRDVHKLSRKRCRDVFERRFTVGRMARDYLRVYSQVAHDSADGPTTPPRGSVRRLHAA
ncbi:glycosyltransferase family 4 protein [Pendulispora brunnea]|uniref:Glycosyltransferase family 4 protein n=1 Tax=Pendulispora brunnea TaxID=2905690 RepID=A0ABZ2JUE2_9BACT